MMRRVRAQLLFAVLAGLLTGSCGSKCQQATCAGGGGVLPETVSCSDGTGATDCCHVGVVAGSSCSANGGSDCWTPCKNGYRGQLICSSRTWSAGKGLFTCGGDGGGVD
jgi:hypothetical protein